MKHSLLHSLDGIVVADKNEGMTSQTLVSFVSRATGCGKAGHSGTLDKFASGVLPVLTGRYTRLARFFMGSPKSYRAAIAFGKTTDTLDPEGEITATGPLPSESRIAEVLPSFLGEVLQRPPEYSSVHVDGKRAYQRALAGEELEMKPRPVRIDAIRLLSYAEGVAVIEVDCGPGTYIRSLARDIAEACGTCAYLASLRRTYSGGFALDAAVKPENMSASSLIAFTPDIASRIGLGTAFLGRAAADDFKLGKPIEHSRYSSVVSTARECHAVFDDESSLPVGIIRNIACNPEFEVVLGDIR